MVWSVQIKIIQEKAFFGRIDVFCTKQQAYFKFQASALHEFLILSSIKH